MNPDQLFSACEYLKLSVRETDFLILIREHEVATNQRRIILLKDKIEKIRRESLKTESAIEFSTSDSIASKRWEYYTDIDLQLVHLFLTVPSFAADPEDICELIGINKARLPSILLKLQNVQLLQFKNRQYKVENPKQHLPEDSPTFLAFGILTRVKTIEKLRRVKSDKADDYFFSTIFLAETKYQNKLKKRILEVLKQTQAEVISVKSEQVYQLNIDFFKWS